MKILIISPSLNFGGAERVASIWANAFSQKGHDVCVFTNLQNGYEFVLDERVVLLPLTPFKGNKLFRYYKAVLNLRNYFNKNQPDVIIGVMWACSLLAKLSSFGLKIPVVATEHNAFERPQGAPMFLRDRFAKFYLNFIYDYITVLTDADYLIVGNRFRNVSVMPNPLGLQPVRDIPHKRNMILSVGRLDGWHVKGFDVLIKSFAKLLRGVNAEGQRVKCNSDDVACKVKREGWKLQIAGTGSEDSINFLKQLCKENGVEDSVEFLGFRKDVGKLYQDASIFVLSSRYEGFGLVLIEAMSQGCACVACDYQGRQREIMNPTPALPRREEDCSIESQSLGTQNLKQEPRNNKVEACETGILCEPDDVEALAEAMKKMIEDDEYRESVRAKAIERSKYYSIENTMDRWEELLNQLK